MGERVDRRFIDPAYEIPDAAGSDVQLLNARDAEHVPDGKSNVNAC